MRDEDAIVREGRHDKERAEGIHLRLPGLQKNELLEIKTHDAAIVSVEREVEESKRERMRRSRMVDEWSREKEID